jgi:hypothetical protein
MDAARMNMERFIPSENIPPQIKPPQMPKIDTPKLVPANTAFKELNANIKKIIELLESIDATLNEMKKNQK